MFTLRLATVLLGMCAFSSAYGQLLIAHRGASHDAPENTLSAFRLAIEQDADGFEGDFWLGAGGHIVCLHDKDTERVAGRKLLATDAPFDDLRALDVGRWKGEKWRGEQLPTFQEVLAEVPAGKKFFIELKSGPEIVAPLAKLIESSPAELENLVIISFSADAIAESKKRLPHIKALWLCSFKKEKGKKDPPSVEEVAATIKRTGADGLDAQAVPEVVDAAFVKRLGELGCRELHVWTVDDPKIAKFYQQLGAQSITTNRPGWLRKKIKL
jgi:glycerophosphoryl diester phosphodiesterase